MSITATCDAKPGTSAAEWFHRGLSLLPGSKEQAARCFLDAALADPLWHEPPLQLGALRAASPPYLTPLINRTLNRAARLALREDNQSAAMQAHRTLGDAAANSGDWRTAADAYLGALQLSPTDCSLSGAAAHAQAREGDELRAVELLRAALAEDHACVLAHHMLAQLLSRQQQFAAALAHARAAIELAPFDEVYEETLRMLEQEAIEHSPAMVTAPGSECSTKGSEHPAPVSATSAQDGMAAAQDSSESAWERLLGGTATAARAADEISQLAIPARERLPFPKSFAPPSHVTAGAPIKGNCPQPGEGKAPKKLLLINPFEEGCFHDDLRSKVLALPHTCPLFRSYHIPAQMLHGSIGAPGHRRNQLVLLLCTGAPQGSSGATGLSPCVQTRSHPARRCARSITHAASSTMCSRRSSKPLRSLGCSAARYSCLASSSASVCAGAAALHHRPLLRPRLQGAPSEARTVRSSDAGPMPVL